MQSEQVKFSSAVTHNISPVVLYDKQALTNATRSWDERCAFENVGLPASNPRPHEEEGVIPVRECGRSF